MSDTIDNLREVANGEGRYTSERNMEIDLTWLLDEIEQYRNGYKGSCYACEPVGEKNVSLRLILSEADPSSLWSVVGAALELMERDGQDWIAMLCNMSKNAANEANESLPRMIINEFIAKT